ncbi:MAG: isoaspartyl peptidase/L-asparaginase [Planctomycetota bacterium]
MKPIIVAHGGVGSQNSFRDGPQKATEEALKVLKKTKSVLKAAIKGAVILEDDPRFDAGTGSNFRLDGKTIEMDASVMDSDGNFGAVIGIQMVKNPVIVAEMVSKSPHLILCGEGATEFSRRRGVPCYNPATPKAKERLNMALQKLALKKIPYWAKKLPSYLSSYLLDEMDGCDTIGVAVSDGMGNFAAACSTGGVSYMLPGRVGDTAIIGCGLYVGKKGAVVATGVGEEIIRRMLSKEVYEQIAREMHPQKACDWGLTLFDDYNKKISKPHRKRIPIGLIAVTMTDYGISATHQMAVGLTHYKRIKI